MRLSGCAVLASVVLAATTGASCGGASAGEAGDGGTEAGVAVQHLDAGAEAASEPADARLDRMTPHRRTILSNMHLRILYIGTAGVDAPPAVEDFVTWLLASDYWGIMKEYGVNKGVLDGSIHMTTSSVFLPGVVQNGLVDVDVLDSRILELLHPPGDAGASDAGDAGTLPVIPKSDAYLVMLPDNVNVLFGTRGTTTEQTCVQAAGYHAFTGQEPYSVMPPCRLGRSAIAISHELAEMATDPLPQDGWFSDADVRNAGGEIGDLCNMPVPRGVEGWGVTQLWSNASGGCIPL